MSPRSQVRLLIYFNLFALPYTDKEIPDIFGTLSDEEPAVLRHGSLICQDNPSIEAFTLPERNKIVICPSAFSCENYLTIGSELTQDHTMAFNPSRNSLTSWRLHYLNCIMLHELTHALQGGK